MPYPHRASRLFRKWKTSSDPIKICDAWIKQPETCEFIYKETNHQIHQKGEHVRIHLKTFHENSRVANFRRNGDRWWPKLWLSRPSRPACRSQVSLWSSYLRARDETSRDGASDGLPDLFWFAQKWIFHRKIESQGRKKKKQCFFGGVFFGPWQPWFWHLFRTWISAVHDSDRLRTTLDLWGAEKKIHGIPNDASCFLTIRLYTLW